MTSNPDGAAVSPLRRILCVEDEPDIRMVARIALERVGGFEVALCSSGREAVEKARGFAPDLILIDVMMPGMDGPATLAALRAVPEIAATAVVFMTAKVQTEEIGRYLEMGVVDIIPKPFDPMTLAATVRGIWERHQAGLAGS